MTLTPTLPAARRPNPPAPPANRPLPPLRRLPVPEPPTQPHTPEAGCPGQLTLDLDGADAAPRRTREAVPDLEARTVAAQLAQAAFEVGVGHRPPVQLVRWTSPRVQARLERRHRLARPRPGAGVPGPVRVLAVRTSRPAPDAVEAAAVVTHRGRTRAVALRMERDGNRWRISALEIG